MSKEFVLPSGVVILSTSDLAGNILTYNAGFRDASGYTDTELKGKPHNLLRHPDMPKEAFQDLWNTLTAGNTWFGIVKNLRKDGDYYWVAANIAPIRDDGQITGYVSVRYPATREQIANSEQLYSDIRAGRKPMPWTKLEKETQYLPLSLAIGAVLSPMVALGMEATSGIALLAVGVASLSGVAYLLKKIQQAHKLSPTLQKGINDIANHRLHLPIAENTEMGCTLNYLRARVAEQMANDYDALRQAQIMLTAMDSASTNIMITDVYFNIINVNKNLRELFASKEDKIRDTLPNFVADQVLGSNMDIFHKHPERQRAVLQNITEPLHAEVNMADMVLHLTVTPIIKESLKIGYVVEWVDRTIEATVVTELAQVFDGMMKGDFSRNIEADADGIYLQIKRDVNDSLVVIKQLFEQLEQAMQELSRAKILAEQASEAKSQFIHNMTHELRTPLNAIIGFIQLLQRETGLTNKHLDYLHQAMTASKHLLEIVNQVLDMSRLEVGVLTLEHEQYHWRKALEDALDMVRVQAEEKSLKFVINIDEKLPEYLVGDVVRLRQVLVNLLNNAIKFTEHGSILLNVQADDRFLQFEIIDTGIGMSEETQKKLYQLFSQANETSSRQHGGIGLGLVFSKSIIEQMGGSIHITSKLGMGTKVNFTHPLHEMTSYHNSDELSKWIAALPEHLDQKNILLVEDNKINQIITLEFLRQMGTSADIANHGQEAIEMRQQKHYDLIILDVQMPIKDGYETIIDIREEEKRTGKHQIVVGLSANGLQQDIDKAKRLGMDDYLTKPVDFEPFQEKLAYWLVGAGSKKAK